MMLKLATVFSGIGAVEEALRQLKIPFETVFACDNGERYLKQTKEELDVIIQKRIDDKLADSSQDAIKQIYDETGKPNKVKASYFANHDITEDRWYEDVRFIDGNKFAGKIDLFVGGSPCQSFSTYGLKRGLEDTRGTLFYDYARLVDEIKPKVFIYENVRGLLSHDKGRTWKIMQSIFEELNYTIYYKVLDAKDFDWPQMRKRIFVVGFRNDLKRKDFHFPTEKKRTRTIYEFLDKEVDDSYYLPEKGFKWVTDWERNQGKARVNRETLGCQTAVQQHNWSGDFRLEEPKESHRNNPDIYIGNYEGVECVARKLTPQECLRLMGFENFNIVNIDKDMYRQSGNSIAVPVMKEVLLKIGESIDIF